MYSAINLFLTNIPILYPLEIPKNCKSSGVLRKGKMETLVRTWSYNTDRNNM